MSYATGTYTDVDNAIVKMMAWAENTLAGATNAYPWTVNNLSVDGTGQRAHISKTINTLDCFFNFRSAVAETIPSVGSVTGICVNGSTAWDGTGTPWNEQTGFTPPQYGAGSPACGVVRSVINTGGGGTFHFFATATTLSFVFETDSTLLDWRMITVGNVGGAMSYFSSGWSAHLEDVIPPYVYDTSSAFLANTNTGGSTKYHNSAVLIPGDGWYPSRTASGWNRGVAMLLDNDYADVAIPPFPKGSLGGPIVAHTPDSFRGNVQLAPSQIVIVKAIATEYWPVGEIEGIKLVNMKFLTNGDEITYDGDTYKMFRVYNAKTPGVAFLK